MKTRRCFWALLCKERLQSQAFEESIVRTVVLCHFFHSFFSEHVSECNVHNPTVYCALLLSNQKAFPFYTAFGKSAGVPHSTLQILCEIFLRGSFEAPCGRCKTPKVLLYIFGLCKRPRQPTQPRIRIPPDFRSKRHR